MDSITQGVLGATIGEAILGKKLGTIGAVIGTMIATIPDLDICLYLIYDKYEMLSIHRGFSHSILFSFIAAFIISYILRKIKWTKRINNKTLFIFSWLCLFTHILLDTFTAYGTQLLLPFSNHRFGLDSVNVVDPVYTIPLAIGLILSLRISKSKSHRSKYNKWGLIISSFYLIFTLINKEIVKSNISTTLSDNDIEYSALLTIPVGISNINWYGVAKGKNRIYMVKYSMFLNKIYPIEVFPINENYLTKIDSKVADKMRWFAKGFYTVEEKNGKIRIFNLQVDMRGIITEGNKKSPTAGYFEISTVNGKTEFSSGSIKQFSITN